MNNEKRLLKYLISNSGKEKNESWYELALRFDLKLKNTKRAEKDSKYKREALTKKANDIWRRYKNKKIIRKRLFFDIETSYNIGKFWRAGYNLNINPQDIIQERKIICISYKWENEDKVETIVWDKNQDDKSLIVSFIKILNEADEIVAHNGDKYDIKFLRTRALFHRIPMRPKYNTYDTLKKARRLFMFNSNKLDYIASFLNVGGKIPTNLSLWDRIILNKDKDALIEMVLYCENDVIILEKVFKVLYNYGKVQVNHASLQNINNDCNCPECGSNNLKSYKTNVSLGYRVNYSMECLDCNSYFTFNKKKYKTWVNLKK